MALHPAALLPKHDSTPVPTLLHFNNEVVKLNIGGYKYQTTARTLVAYSPAGNYFSSLLSGRIPATHKDKKGFYFIDRDGYYFAPILEYLRTGELMIPPGMSSKAVYREANFFSIDLPPLDNVPLETTLTSPQDILNGIFFEDLESAGRFIMFGLDGRGSLGGFKEFTYEVKGPIISLTKDPSEPPTQLLLHDGKLRMGRKPLCFLRCAPLLLGVCYTYRSKGIKLYFGRGGYYYQEERLEAIILSSESVSTTSRATSPKNALASPKPSTSAASASSAMPATRTIPTTTATTSASASSAFAADENIEDSSATSLSAGDFESDDASSEEDIANMRGRKRRSRAATSHGVAYCLLGSELGWLRGTFQPHDFLHLRAVIVHLTLDRYQCAIEILPFGTVLLARWFNDRSQNLPTDFVGQFAHYEVESEEQDIRVVTDTAKKR